jgi:hypothetical protein
MALVVHHLMNNIHYGSQNLNVPFLNIDCHVCEQTMLGLFGRKDDGGQCGAGKVFHAQKWGF